MCAPINEVQQVHNAHSLIDISLFKGILLACWHGCPPQFANCERAHLEQVLFYNINCMFIFRVCLTNEPQFDVNLPNFIYKGTFPLNAAAPSASQVCLSASAWESHAKFPKERDLPQLKVQFTH
jgi:hypothetical protein